MRDTSRHDDDGNILSYEMLRDGMPNDDAEWGSKFACCIYIYLDVVRAATRGPL